MRLLEFQVRTSLLFILFSLGQIHAAPRVRVGNTTLVGTEIPTFGQDFFAGIAYAQPPVGQLRFAPPVPQFFLNASVYNASSYGAACPQTGMMSSEDCLFVNILRPSKDRIFSKLPVMVWIFGGGFYGGDSSLFNGSQIVAHSVARGTPVIYVSLNYRVGSLGFPQGIEATSEGALNLGLRDQLTALQWVKRNIETFGGDPTKVTVFGESAGAISINILMLSASFSDIARAAIMESGTAPSVILYNGTEREAVWQSFVKAVPECSNIIGPQNSTFECLRKANLSTILAAQTSAYSSIQEEFPFVPVIDGPDGLLPDYPSNLWMNGSFSRIPFISGTNLDEGTAFTPSDINSTEQIRQWIISNSTPSNFPMFAVKHTADEVLTLYPDIPALGCPFNTGNNTFGLSPEFKRASAIIGDIFFHSLRRLWTQTAVSLGVDAWGYLFTDPQPNSVPALGVTHASELPYVYGEINSSSSATALSLHMLDYWISFATCLHPNDLHGNISRARWMQYTSKNKAIIQLNGMNTTMILDDYRQQQISYINSNALVFLH